MVINARQLFLINKFFIYLNGKISKICELENFEIKFRILLGFYQVNLDLQTLIDLIPRNIR